MRFLANLSIRNKIAGIILITTILALGTGFSLVIVTSLGLFEEHLVQTIDVIARAAGDYSAFGLAFEDQQEAEDSLAKLKEFDNVAEAHLYDNDKNLFVSFSRSGSTSPPAEVHDSHWEIEDGFVHLFTPVTWQGERYGTIYVKGTTEELVEQQRKHLATMATVMGALVVAAVVFAYFLQGLISKPILDLAAKAQEISAKADYSIRVEKPGNDEIGILYDGFNDMLAQIQLRQEELERSNRDLDQFAYVASHDLKAPLRAIATLSGWLEEDIADALSDDGRKQMQLLRSRVGRMDALIEGILRYSRAGRTDGQGELVDVARLLAEVVELLSPPPGFEIRIGPGMPRFFTRRLRLSQIFSNLINNAIKYHHREDGKIEITAEERDGCYEFAVSDDGPGIPRQHHERVFVMFQTLQPRDEVESTGLGLSLVKKLVEEEGGRIVVESEEGQGATFRFTWPAGKGAAPTG